ncbi:MAG: hypothetical protein K8T90_16855 [Planctomycetes bacterium]|nr:hypothetical protein [Planctomycetota bacterium]
MTTEAAPPPAAHPQPSSADRRAVIAERVLLGVVAVVFVVALLNVGRPTLRGDVKWGAHLIAETPKRILFSSHLAQVTGWAALESGVADRARDAMSFVSRCGAFAWAAAAVAFVVATAGSASSTSLGNRFATRIPLLVALMLTPLTLFFCGYEELGHLGAPFALLAAALLVAGRSPLLAALAVGCAAAVHGVGFALVPGLLAACWLSETTRFRRIVTTIAAAHVVFVPTVVCVLAYRVALPRAVLSAGDAFGGASGRLLLPVWGEYRGVSLWSVDHWAHVARIGWRGAPAVIVALAACCVPRVRAGLADWIVRRRGVVLLAVSAFGFVAHFFAGYGPRYDADLLIPACALLNVAACLFVADSPLRATWTWVAVMASLVGWVRLWEWMG